MNKKTMGVMFSSENQIWETPQDLFQKLDEEYHFTLDVCALPQNAKCEKYYTPEVDGLKQNWEGNTCWMNPPYQEPEKPCKPNCKKKKCAERGYHTSEYIPGQVDWIRKAYEESQKPNTKVVCLIPSRTDTKLWHNYVMLASEIRFVKGRLKFGNADTGAPFPSAIVVFDANNTSKQSIRSMD